MKFRQLAGYPLLPNPLGRVFVYWLVVLAGIAVYRLRPEPVWEYRTAKTDDGELVVFELPDIEKDKVHKPLQQMNGRCVSIDINSASVEELCKLRGIGPVLAARIVAYRDQNGTFQSLDELVNVKGIGPKSVEKLKSQTVKLSR